jgi:hypothetical protein
VLLGVDKEGVVIDGVDIFEEVQEENNKEIKKEKKKLFTRNLVLPL